MKISKAIKYPRGSIWWLNYDNNPNRYGSVQGKSRPVVIISNNYRGKSTVVEVCSITHMDHTNVCPRINIPFYNHKGEINYIQCNQHFTVDIRDLDNFISMLTEETIKDMDSGLLVAQGMDYLIDSQKKYRICSTRLIV